MPNTLSCATNGLNLLRVLQVNAGFKNTGDYFFRYNQTQTLTTLGISMNNRLQKLFGDLSKLEEEITDEIKKKGEEFSYTLQNKRIKFTEEVVEEHRRQVKKLSDYILQAPLRHILTAPVIWSLIVPAIFLDLMVSVYQMLCFPVYNIPKVKRSEYIVIDRRFLKYLNIIEKMNCLFCSYFNGLIAFVQEVAARTEQYWCPIKHAQNLLLVHSRYKNFVDYGHAQAYRETFQKIRRDYSDLDEKNNQEDT